jgi:hypothetical protein
MQTVGVHRRRRRRHADSGRVAVTSRGGCSAYSWAVLHSPTANSNLFLTEWLTYCLATLAQFFKQKSAGLALGGQTCLVKYNINLSACSAPGRQTCRLAHEDFCLKNWGLMSTMLSFSGRKPPSYFLRVCVCVISWSRLFWGRLHERQSHLSVSF